MLTIDTLSTRITDSITNSSETSREEKEIIEYGISIALSEITKLTAVLVLSVPFGLFKYTLFIIVVLGILRSFLGGIHAHTHLGCFLSYCSVIISVICLSTIASPFLLKLLAIVSFPLMMLVIYLYAPADIENKPVVSQKKRRFLRKGSFITVFCIYLFMFFLPQTYSALLLFTVIEEAVTMLPVTYRITKNKYGIERGLSL